MTAVPLHRLAHARTGDKGNRLNVSLIVHDPADWDLLKHEVTEARVLHSLPIAALVRCGVT